MYSLNRNCYARCKGYYANASDEIQNQFETNQHGNFELTLCFPGALGMKVARYLVADSFSRAHMTLRLSWTMSSWRSPLTPQPLVSSSKEWGLSGSAPSRAP